MGWYENNAITKRGSIDKKNGGLKNSLDCPFKSFFTFVRNTVSFQKILDKIYRCLKSKNKKSPPHLFELGHHCEVSICCIEEYLQACEGLRGDVPDQVLHGTHVVQ